MCKKVRNKEIKGFWNILLVITLVLASIWGVISLIVYFGTFRKFSSESNDWDLYASMFSSFVGTVISAITLVFLIIDRSKQEKEKLEIDKEQLVITYINDHRSSISLVENFETEANCVRNELETNASQLVLSFVKEKEIDELPDNVKNAFEKIKANSPLKDKSWDELSNYELFQLYFHIAELNMKDIILTFSLDDPIDQEYINYKKDLKYLIALLGKFGVKTSYFKAIYKKYVIHALDLCNKDVFTIYKQFRYHVKKLANNDEGLKYYLSFISIKEKELLSYIIIARDDYDIANILVSHGYYGGDGQKNIENKNIMYGFIDSSLIRDMLLFSDFDKGKPPYFTLQTPDLGN